MPVSFHPIHRVVGGALVLLVLVVLTSGYSMYWARTPPARGGTDAGVLLKSERLLMGTSFNS